MNITFLPIDYLITLRQLLAYNDLLGTFLGLIVNSILLLVLYIMDKNEINKYKRILVLVTFTDFLLAISNSVAMLSMETFNGYILLFSEGVTIWISDKSFVYVFVWNSLALVFLYFCVIPFETPDYQEVYDDVMTMYSLELKSYGRKLLLLDIFLIYGFLYNVHLIITSTIVVTIIYYSYFSIRKELKKQSLIMSKRSSELQNQLNRVMFLHALVPICLSFFPSTVFVASDYLQINLKGLGTLLFFTIEWTPFVNGMISLTMINACKKTFYKIIGIESSSEETTQTPNYIQL
uniref:G_PROTEIN_RECEP_F1_2 domain-containing protein n=1 Tax=Parastrongyloides trichosuri TaxID=131310 RepID=A0A0N4ZI56_PARTI